MNITREQFINQKYFWQDKYYSYAIHITDAGAKYLWQVEGVRLSQEQLNKMRVLRLDGADINKLINYLQEEDKI